MSVERYELSPLAQAILSLNPLRRPATAALFTLSLGLSHSLSAAELNIPSQALEGALRELGQQSGLQILYSPEVVQGKRAPAVNGDLEPETALRRLLNGTGIRYQVENGTVVLSGKAGTDSMELGATTINSSALGQTTEGTGSYTTGATGTATKMPLSLRETPQSVSVITRQLMDDQNLKTLDEVLNFTPGITINHRDSERYTFYSRGFAIQNYQYDGIPSQIVNESQQYTGSLLDMALYDRVEVLRGATGLMSGAGYPSATINLVRKRPTDDFQSYLYTEAGTWDRYRGEGDVSGPLNDSGTIRGRLVGAYQEQNSFVDYYKQDKRVLYGALDFDVTDDTLLRLSLDYQNNNSDGVSFGHIPLFYSDGSQTHFPRSFNPATRWSYLDNTHYNFTGLIEQKLAHDWSLKAAYSHQYSYREGTTGSASGGKPDPETGAGGFMFVNRLDSHQYQDTVDVYATGPFSLLGREHELVVGGSTSRTHLNFPTYERMNPEVPNIFEWNGDQIGKPHFSKLEDNLSLLRQSGVYVAAKLKPIDPLSIILGSRVTWWDERDENSDAFTGETLVLDKNKKSGKIIPYAGITYDLNENYSVYASYTNIFLPQMYYKTASNSSLDPLEGDNYEIGVKGEFLDGKLNASVALFEVKQDNLPQYVDADPVSGREIYEAISGTTTKGIETEISGEVMTDWKIFGGYTYRESKDSEHRRIETNQPMNLFKLGTTYRLPGDFNRLTIGGNVIWQSEMYYEQEFDGRNRKATQDDYAVVGLLANYEVDKHLTVGLNVNNLFDEKYYDGIGTFGSGSYGEPRNAVINAKWQF
ncbi:TonB-dependent siderophore receptor [Pseudomonas sp. RIT-PI-AD]|uniref:TonB-dependent siderophore receptor n=1 Tax=Pseudomonas sp. RIT-PI-AD TaxID=3035294 RepID=UPI0021D8FC83|nr:TonB-dependent siderophore receptor [Pseudomonas sp. RIT-PI-AD]